MTIQGADASEVGYLRETSPGEFVSGTYALIRRVSADGLGLGVDTYDSEEIRGGRSLADSRHGARKIEGELATQVALAELDDFWQGALCASEWFEYTVSGLMNLGVVVSAAPANTLYSDVRNYSQYGVGPGTRVLITSGLPANSGYATVLGVSDDGHTLTVDKDLEAETATVTVLPLGKRAVSGAAINLFNIERAFRSGSGTRYYDTMRGVVVADVAVEVDSEFVTALWGVRGIDALSMSSSSQNTYDGGETYRPISSESPLDFLSGALLMVIGGVPQRIGVLTNISFSIDNKVEAASVVGSRTSPGVTLGDTQEVSGKLTVLFESEQLYNIFEVEQEATLVVVLEPPDSVGTRFLTFAFPRCKFFTGDIDDSVAYGLPVDIEFRSLRTGASVPSIIVNTGGAQLLTDTPEYYFDSFADPGGDGSALTPFNDLSFLATLSGDQLGAKFYLKRMSTFVAPLIIADGVSNYTLSTYGRGKHPFISNFQRLDTSIWTNLGGNLFRANISEVGGSRCGLISDPDYTYFRPGLFIQRFFKVFYAPRDTLGELTSGDYIEDSSTYVEDGKQYLSFFDVGAGYFYVQGYDVAGIPPVPPDPPTGASGASIRNYVGAPDVSVPYAASIGSGSNVLIQGIGFAGGYHTTLRIGHVDNLTLDGVRAIATAGNSTVSDQDIVTITGTSEASKVQGLIVRNSEIGMGLGEDNSGLSLSHVEGASITLNEFADLTGAAIRLRDSTVATTVDRNKFIMVDEFIRPETGSATTHHDGLRARNNVFRQRTSYVKQGGIGPGNPTGHVLKHTAGEGRNYSNFRYVNNTFLLDDGAVLDMVTTGSHALGDKSFTFKNNLVILQQRVSETEAQREPAIWVRDTASASAVDMDYNVYWFGDDHQVFDIVGAGRVSGQGNYRAAWSGYGNEQNSLVVPAATSVMQVDGKGIGGAQASFPFPVDVTGPVIGAADVSDPDYPDDDFMGIARTANTVGAYEWRADAYEFGLTNNGDAGREKVGFSFGPVQSFDIWDADNNATGRDDFQFPHWDIANPSDFLVGISYPNVPFTGPVQRAVITFQVLKEYIPGEGLIRAQLPPCSQYTVNAYLPSKQRMSEEYQRVILTRGRKEIDVTGMVNEALSHPSWTPGRLNFTIEAWSSGVDVNLSAENSRTVRLLLVP